MINIPSMPCGVCVLHTCEVTLYPRMPEQQPARATEMVNDKDLIYSRSVNILKSWRN